MAHFKKRGKGYTVFYYATDPETGRRVQRSESGFPTLKAAKAWNTERESRELTGFKGVPSSMTVADYAAEWFASRRPTDYAEATLHSYNYLITRYIVPHLGTHRLTRLEDRHVERWHATLLKQGLSPGTVGAAHRVLSMMLTDAVRRKRLAENVARLAGGPPSERRPKMRAWNLDQAHTFLRYADGHKDGLPFRVMLMTAIRPGELLALKWSDIDWQRGTVTIQRTITIDTDGKVIIGDTTKTPASHRTLTLQSSLLSALRKHRATQNEMRLKMSSRWYDHGLVFPSANGTPMDRRVLRERLRRMAGAASVPYITSHGLRHTAATLMVAMGEHPEAISEILGHKNISITLDLYSHLDESMRRPTSERLAALLDETPDEDISMTRRPL